MAREYLRITPETTWGTFNAGGTHTVLDLAQSNAFTMRPSPVRWSIRSAGGYNRRRQTGSSKTAFAGNLNVIGYGSQMAALAPLFVATSGNVLGSVTIDHALVMEDSGPTTVYSRHLGVMAPTATLSCSEQDPLLRLALGLIAKQSATITVTDFAEPAVTAYPTDAPYVFEHASGAVTIGTSRSEWESFSLSIKNMIDTSFMGNAFISRAKYCGRDVDFSTKFPYVITTDRSDYEAVTAVSASITFTNGAHSLAFDMKSQNFFAKVDDDLSLDKLYLQGIDMEAYFDGTAGNDFTLTVT
jgi:hypothetical protein